MKKLIILLSIFSLFIISCSNKQVTIAISKGAGSESYDNYVKWIKEHEPEAEVVDLYFIDKKKAIKILKKSDGLLLSGGPDIHPGRYGKIQDTSRCDIDLYRDTLEFEIVKLAMEKEIPILGVCRGFQVLNVAMGGTLIVDIPSDTDSRIIHQDKNNPNIKHNVKVFENSKLFAKSKVNLMEVNSNHHQAIGILAEVFLPSAASDDGLIEALEYREPNKPYLMAVGWHPERLPFKHPLSFYLGNSFIEAAKQYKTKK